MEHAVATLKKGEGRLLKAGGMWVFDNEIESVMGSFTQGDVVLIRDSGQRFYQHSLEDHDPAADPGRA